MQWVSIVALFLFILVNIGIGLWSMRKAKTMEGFLLGGRKIGAWMSAFAYGTSYFSAVVFVGYAGTHGWNIGVGALWIGIGNAVLGCLLAWKLLAERTRTITHTLNTRTMPGFFEGRYGSKNMKMWAALVIFIFLMPYAASVYKGLGYLFSVIFPGLNGAVLGLSANELCIVLVGIITSIYLVLGGYIATALNDFVQGIIMLFGVVVMCICVVAYGEVGGLTNAFHRLGELGKVDGKQLTHIFGGTEWRFLLTNILLTSFGTWGLPQMVHKFYAVKDRLAVKRATVISTVFALIIGCGAYFFGLFGRLVVGPELPAGGVDAIIPNMLQTVFGGGFLGSLMLSLILVLLLSASMSTLSAVVMTSASAISVDFRETLKRGLKKGGEKSGLALTRVLCVVFIAASVLFATQQITIIVSIMSFSWGIVSGSFIGPFIWGIYSRRITKTGAWAGMLGGFLTVVVMTVVYTVNSHIGDVSWYAAFQTASKDSPTFGVCAMAMSLVLVPVVSLFTKPMDAKHVARVFAGMGGKRGR